MQLSKRSLNTSKNIETPDEKLLQLAEKVLQFGTGVLLRGLVDFYIDKANKQGLFNGRVVVVKSTEGNVDKFTQQDNLYTVCVCGIDGGREVEEYYINSAISRVVSANEDWAAVLQCAASKDLQVIVSNTTEVGITLSNDDIHASPPKTFPGKLLAFLYERYKIFKGNTESGMVIIPTELLPENGKKLKEIVITLANKNNLEKEFIDWLENSNEFCDSLVDRIVPGKPAAGKKKEIEAQLSYEDELMLMAESYNLWAIQSSSERTKEILSFSKTNEGVVIAPDIFLFRELKLRLLNGTHTLCCGLAHLAGFTTVKEAMDDKAFAAFMQTLMLHEIIPAIINNVITPEAATTFAHKTLERFSNPFIQHKWLSITLQYTSKMAMRNVPIITSYYKHFSKVPQHYALGFAAHILFMKCNEADSKYVGEFNGKTYPVNDDHAAFYAEVWQQENSLHVTEQVLGNIALWKTDLNALPGFTKAVADYLKILQHEDVLLTIIKS